MKNKKYFVFSFVLIAIIIAGLGLFAHASPPCGPPCGVTLPSPPTGVTATVVQPAQISVSWDASTESSGTIEGYDVYREGVRIATTDDTTFTDSGLAPGYYAYTIAAFDANGVTSAQSSPPATATLVKNTTPPTSPTDVTITGTTSTNSIYGQVTLTISWIGSTDPIGVAGYDVYRNGTEITTSTSAAFTENSITDTVTPGTYTYIVVAYDAARNFSNQSTPTTITVIVDNAPPSVPTNLSAQQVSASSVNLSWATSTDSVGIAWYQIYRDGTQIATTSNTSYSDTGLSVTIRYMYSVAAVDVAGNVSGESVSTEITIHSTLGGPSTPYLLSATLLGTSTVGLLWNPSADILAIGAYNIYRNGTQIASVSSTNYQDEGLVPGTYVYGVSATDVNDAISSTSLPMSVVVPAVVFTPAPIAPTPVVASSSAIVPPGAVSGASPVSAGTGSPTFTESLYFGLRATQVEALQSLLVARGYLPPADATGFFGSLTQQAVQRFQCDNNIACSGASGWGVVGPRTRIVLNAFASGSMPTPSSSSSATSLNAENTGITTRTP